MGADEQVIVPSRESSAFPDVSVVMPVHDMPLALVRKAIRSVRKQDHPGPIEVVLWDDGSRDPVLRAAYAAIAGVVRRRRRPGGGAGDRYVPYRRVPRGSRARATMPSAAPGPSG